jgi:hypothetical protein
MVPVTWELTVRSIENEVDERDLRVLSKKKKIDEREGYGRELANKGLRVIFPDAAKWKYAL